MPASKALLAPFKAQARGLFLAPLMLTLDRQHALLCLTVAVPDIMVRPQSCECVMSCSLANLLVVTESGVF